MGQLCFCVLGVGFVTQAWFPSCIAQVQPALLRNSKATFLPIGRCIEDQTGSLAPGWATRDPRPATLWASSVVFVSGGPLFFCFKWIQDWPVLPAMDSYQSSCSPLHRLSISGISNDCWPFVSPFAFCYQPVSFCQSLRTIVVENGYPQRTSP